MALARTSIRAAATATTTTLRCPTLKSRLQLRLIHNTFKPTTLTRASFSSKRSFSSTPPVRNQAQQPEDMAEPTGLIATSGIEVLTFGTPNGYKISILLEELKQLYGDKFPKVTYQSVNIMKNTQKEAWFTAICPNGRIPAIVDHDRGKFPVFEGLAILHYITKHYDPENKLSFAYDSDDYSVAEQWMSWQHGGLGPMFVSALSSYELYFDLCTC